MLRPRRSTNMHHVQGQSAASLQSLCKTKWLLKLGWGWHYVRSNAKIAESLLFTARTDVTIKLVTSQLHNLPTLIRGESSLDSVIMVAFAFTEQFLIQENVNNLRNVKQPNSFWRPVIWSQTQSIFKLIQVCTIAIMQRLCVRCQEIQIPVSVPE